MTCVSSDPFLLRTANRKRARRNILFDEEKCKCLLTTNTELWADLNIPKGMESAAAQVGSILRNG
jgi:hypothetical protein